MAFVGVSALLFAASAAVTIVWCASMSAMGGMWMPGDWTMSMAWMRRPGQTWPGAAASFLVMWVVMMVAMMLPSLLPMLWRYRQAVGRPGETRLGRLTALVGAGYFFVWTALGMAVFPLGVALATVEMERPALALAVPSAVAVVVLIAGALQFTPWKARQPISNPKRRPTPGDIHRPIHFQGEPNETAPRHPAMLAVCHPRIRPDHDAQGQPTHSGPELAGGHLLSPEADRGANAGAGALVRVDAMADRVGADRIGKAERVRLVPQRDTLVPVREIPGFVPGLVVTGREPDGITGARGAADFLRVKAHSLVLGAD